MAILYSLYKRYIVDIDIWQRERERSCFFESMKLFQHETFWYVIFDFCLIFQLENISWLESIAVTWRRAQMEDLQF